MRNFTTMPPPGTPGKFSFSFGSCIMKQFPDFWTQVEGFNQIAARNPDLLLLIGDQIYGDLPIPLGIDSYPAEWRDAKSDIAYQNVANKVPVFQMYDDHEVFDNWVRGWRDLGVFGDLTLLFSLRMLERLEYSHRQCSTGISTRSPTIQIPWYRASTTTPSREEMWPSSSWIAAGTELPRHLRDSLLPITGLCSAKGNFRASSSGWIKLQ